MVARFQCLEYGQQTQFISKVKDGEKIEKLSTEIIHRARITQQIVNFTLSDTPIYATLDSRATVRALARAAVAGSLEQSKTVEASPMPSGRLSRINGATRTSF